MFRGVSSTGHFCGERKHDPKFHQLLETTNDRGLKGHRLTWQFSLLCDYATSKIDGTTPTWPLGHLLGVAPSTFMQKINHSFELTSR